MLGENSSLEGLRITRYSNNPSSYGVLLIEAPAHGTLLRHIEVIDSAFQSGNLGAHVGLPSEPPLIAPARDPPQPELAFEAS